MMTKKVFPMLAAIALLTIAGCCKKNCGPELTPLRLHLPIQEYAIDIKGDDMRLLGVFGTGDVSDTAAVMISASQSRACLRVIENAMMMEVAPRSNSVRFTLRNTYSAAEVEVAIERDQVCVKNRRTRAIIRCIPLRQANVYIALDERGEIEILE